MRKVYSRGHTGSSVPDDLSVSPEKNSEKNQFLRHFPPPTVLPSHPAVGGASTPAPATRRWRRPTSPARQVPPGGGGRRPSPARACSCRGTWWPPRCSTPCTTRCASMAPRSSSAPTRAARAPPTSTSSHPPPTYAAAPFLTRPLLFHGGNQTAVSVSRSLIPLGSVLMWISAGEVRRSED